MTVLRYFPLKPLVEIWAFEDAPKELQELSPHGGDEDYIVIVREEDNSVVYQMQGGGFLGLSFWTMHRHNDEQVWIGAHS